MLQNALIDYFGFDGFDFIAKIIEHRNMIICFSNETLKLLEKLNEQGKGALDTFNGRSEQVTFAQKDQKQLAKKLRNLQRKVEDRLPDTIAQLEQLGFNRDYLEEQQLLGFQKNRVDKESAADAAMRNVLEMGGSLAGQAWRPTLPPGTEHIQTDITDEFFVPAPPKANVPNKDLVAASTLTSWQRKIFSNIKRFNPMQSKVFDVALNSNQNVLVCAPTGAGKTNVALLTITREIGQHISENGIIAKTEFKVVYVAPMKALAQEITSKFSERLKPLGLDVKEFTGDMQLTRAQLQTTNVIVTTPEKWDVVTRKSADNELVSLVKLIIIDEVHLLADERGSVIESLVARTLRRVESTQSMVRIVALSATLPNPLDVARFLRVNEQTGLFQFKGDYRPVPLAQRLIGVKEKNVMKAKRVIDTIAYEHAFKSVCNDDQVMIFVHSRKGTQNAADAILDEARNSGEVEAFIGAQSNKPMWVDKFKKARTKDLRKLLPCGFGIHHAGLPRTDRNLVEAAFAAGAIRVLCCTATLAWGVNLPAHTVIIKGTEIYNQEKGCFTDVSILDVQQIFGRAGRPQFDTSGEAILITNNSKMPTYKRMLLHQAPIESNFIKALPDHLNAEIVAGTVVDVDEAVRWLEYTYLYQRIIANPLHYGSDQKHREQDPLMLDFLRKRVIDAATRLDKVKMIRFVYDKTRPNDHQRGEMGVTHSGRVASYYYVRHQTMEIFLKMLKFNSSHEDLVACLAMADEFTQLRVREEEDKEMKKLGECTVMPVKGAPGTTQHKTELLMQAFISRETVDAFTLSSDMYYIQQNGGRLSRALFELALYNNFSYVAAECLDIAKSITNRFWWYESELRQFSFNDYGRRVNNLEEALAKIESRDINSDDLREMTFGEIQSIVRTKEASKAIYNKITKIPNLILDVGVQPVSAAILRINLTIEADFDWSPQSGSVEPFWVWIEDDKSEFIYQQEQFLLHKKQRNERHEIVFTIPVPQGEDLPSQFYIRVLSDKWNGVQFLAPVSFKHLLLPRDVQAQTELMDLKPLPTSALQDDRFQQLYPFSHFNPVQTQFFHVLYHTDHNVLLGAPTGSGKTVAAELAVMRMLRANDGRKCVYVAPLKALVKERLSDWNDKYGRFGFKILELTGDVTPDASQLRAADVLITTPEKWDGVSRDWANRSFVQQVSLVVIDEIHLLGEDRGPVLEVIVSRMRYISEQTENHVRFVGLSTALSNAQDVADWLGVKPVGLFNFKPSIRPVPCETFFQGFPEKHYCPRMATMNKPLYSGILQYSPTKPVLVFVASRRQTRLTALDLVSLCAADASDPSNFRPFLHMPFEEIELISTTRIKDKALADNLLFGIGMHHAGLCQSDRRIVEELYLHGKIQVLVSTATLAWGVNLPAHLVVVKGTEFYDAKTCRYKDYPITDVLQMIGRAGRPQFDNSAFALVYCHSPKKNFFKKFLYSPFPVESQLFKVLPDHLNAEIVGGTISSMKDAVEYLSWTYLFRRLLVNPSFYVSTDDSSVGRAIDCRSTGPWFDSGSSDFFGKLHIVFFLVKFKQFV
eukprot:TRINITY_DN838_c0_g1_i2.p1 TRINITY_DN838_c0_g1~~TRINITY_DN838_c0_g1_i2.p1  ORF type:complete len:1736 (-),score=582.30 TRINITY_DN838_c0_g1_i2:39-4685(-)